MTRRCLFHCGGLAIPHEPGEECHRLALWGAGQNIDIKLTEMSSALTAGVPPIVADLLDVATYVYTADQAITRGGDTSGPAGSLWRRKMRMAIPVRQPDVWRSPAVLRSLQDLLGFLSDDEWSFNFEAITEAPPVQTYFEFGTSNAATTQPQEVVLFSGGLDSLAGVVEEVIRDERRPILVTHHSATKMMPRQDTLVRAIRQRSAADRVMHIPIRTLKNQDLFKEYTQRTRSFLYASLAASVGRMAGLSRIRFFENGVVSLNFPVGEQVVGARNTRTTHPRVITGLQEFFGRLFGTTMSVENAYIWKTKGDVVRILAQNGCADLIDKTVSCTRVFDLTNLHTHCGTCSQCLDRRFAVLAANLGEYEPAHRYASHVDGSDLLTSPRDAGEARTMAELFYKRAFEIGQMDDRAFMGRYAGELSRVLNHLPGGPDEVARRVIDLHRRHAQEVKSVVENGIARHANDILNHALPPTSLMMIALPKTNLDQRARERSLVGEAPRGDQTLVLTITETEAKLDGVPIITAVKAKTQWKVLRYFVDRWAQDSTTTGGRPRHRYHRLVEIHSALKKEGVVTGDAEENTRQHIVKLKKSFSEKYWNAKGRSLDANAVIQTGDDGRGYRLRPSGLAVTVTHDADTPEAHRSVELGN